VGDSTFTFRFLKIIHDQGRGIPLYNKKKDKDKTHRKKRRAILYVVEFDPIDPIEQIDNDSVQSPDNQDPQKLVPINNPQEPLIIDPIVKPVEEPITINPTINLQEPVIIPQQPIQNDKPTEQVTMNTTNLQEPVIIPNNQEPPKPLNNPVEKPVETVTINPTILQEPVIVPQQPIQNDKPTEQVTNNTTTNLQEPIQNDKPTEQVTNNPTNLQEPVIIPQQSTQNDKPTEPVTINTTTNVPI